MATTSPHQPESLSDKITRLKSELDLQRAARDQILLTGQTTSGAGMSTTGVSYERLCERISWLEAQIEALTAQLVGDPVPAPGIVLQSFGSEYN